MMIKYRISYLTSKKNNYNSEKKIPCTKQTLAQQVILEVSMHNIKSKLID